jgi:C-terminal processing protease CtpA/Prc
MHRRLCTVVLAVSVGLGGAEIALPQQPKKLDAYDLSLAHMMLRMVYEEIEKHYYDPKLHGVDLAGAYARVDKALNGATTKTETFLLIAAFVSALDDSHTYFIPPERTNRMDRGFEMEVVGDSCYVERVRPKTDAALKLHPGDQILSINGYNAKRKSFEMLDYLSQILVPAPTLTLALKAPDGIQRTEVVQASYRQGKQLLDISGGEGTVDYEHMILRDQNEARRNRERMAVVGDTMVWKMPDFDGSIEAINDAFARAKSHPALVLDLRGNPGGEIDILKLMLAHLFSREITLANRVMRKETKPDVVKAGLLGAYQGKLVVVIDGDSGSAAELFARVIQLEHRGLVIGDTSAGAVMEAREYQESFGDDTKVFYWLSVTSADLVMTDGKSLEKAGVVPDVVALPSAHAMAAGEDPVLAQAIGLAGGQIDAATAGRMFPYEWPEL